MQMTNAKEQIEKWAKTEEEKKVLLEKVKEFGENFDQVAKFVSLRTIDALWLEHLENMEYLRDSVKLRAYGQQDPLIEYKNEGHKAFQYLLNSFEKNVVNTLLQASLKPTQVQPSSVVKPSGDKKVGRNDPCPCGSGKKYKKCHGK